MTYKSLLTFVDESTSLNDLKPLLEKAAEANVHLTVHVLEIALPNPALRYGYAPFGTIIIPDTWQQEIEEGGRALAQRVGEVEALMQAEGVSGSVTSSFCEKGFLADEVSKRAAVNDVAMLPKHGSLAEDIWGRVLEGVLFHSPSGIIVGNDFGFWPGDCKQVFIACNNGIEAMRAVRNALVTLKEAENVTIGLFDPLIGENADGEEPGADLAAWLSRHGCKVTIQQFPSGGMEIGKAIILRAKELGSDLVVMGAYGHSRLRQSILGGTTATMIEQKELPVFFSH